MPDESTNKLLFNKLHSLVFDCEPEKIKYTNDVAKSNLIVMLCRYGNTDIIEQYNYLKDNGYTNQPVCALNLFHIDETQRHLGSAPTAYFDPHEVLASVYGKDKVFVVHHNHAQKEHPDLVYYDMMYARSKLYYIEYENHDMNDRVWTYNSSKKMYELGEIKKTPNPKHYLAPMRTFDNNSHFSNISRVKYRKQLRDFLPKDKGYISDLANGVVLIPQEHNDNIVKHFASLENDYAGGTWYPVHNDYYNDSLVSIYVESITYGTEVTSLTEKTFDPLIKGHFVLPYGYKGLIKDILSYGFILPNWLDYSYDDYDDDRRWEKYLLSVSKYINTPIEELVGHVHNDMHILHHNRAVFYNRPKDSLVDIIEERMKSRPT
jgi:hypothetical protein